MFADHGRKIMVQKKTVTDANYIPRAEKFRENDIKRKMLRPQFKQKKFTVERLPKFEFGNLGKRSRTFKTFNTFGTLTTF